MVFCFPFPQGPVHPVCKMSSQSEMRQRLAPTWDHYEQQFLSKNLMCNQEDSVEKWCWVRGSGRVGSLAGMDASGRGGTARDGLLSKGPATALVGGTSGRQPLVWVRVETCHACLWGPVPELGHSAPAPPASLPCRDADLQDWGLGPTCPPRPGTWPHAEGEVPPPALSSPEGSVGPQAACLRDAASSRVSSCPQT